MRFRLRTLLIVLALGPVVLAGGFWLWQSIPQRKPPWDMDGFNVNPLPPNKPGHQWKLTRQGIIEVPAPDLAD